MTKSSQILPFFSLLPVFAVRLCCVHLASKTETEMEADFFAKPASKDKQLFPFSFFLRFCLRVSPCQSVEATAAKCQSKFLSRYAREREKERRKSFVRRNAIPVSALLLRSPERERERESKHCFRTSLVNWWERVRFGGGGI